MSSGVRSFVQLPEMVLFSHISDRAVRLWAVLEHHQSKNAYAFPSLTCLMAEMGCSKDSAIRAVKELEAAQLLEVDRRRNAKAVNRYVLVGRIRPVDKPSTGGRRNRPQPSTSGRKSTSQVVAESVHEPYQGNHTGLATPESESQLRPDEISTGLAQVHALRETMKPAERESA